MSNRKAAAWAQPGVPGLLGAAAIAAGAGAGAFWAIVMLSGKVGLELG